MRKYYSYLISISKKKLRFVIALSVIVFNLSCVEPYEGDFGSFEDVLVVNAIITNELKRQEVTLTRSYRFEEEEPPFETDAEVSITTSNGNQYNFEETQQGVYKSIEPFAAELQSNYILNITTSSGRTYRSTPMELPVANTTIDDVFAERIINDNGEEGITINIDSFDSSGSSKFYRHDFIETFKIIAPFWSPFDAVFVIEGFETFEIPVILREQEEQICYSTNNASTINVVSTQALVEDRLDDYSVRFVNRDNYILSHRYSILVKQYVLSPETFAYYDTLKGLSQSSTTVFSEDQPGFLAGNIISLTDPDENIAGYFEVSTVAEQRLFFSYEDFFPGEELPPYVISCVLQKPSTAGNFGERDLVNIIREESMRFFDYNTNPQPGEGPYIMVIPQCGDCTTLGSNIVPDFWVE
ncbi:DUF4249 domain-containing protein [uncultured Winogradskyella sp.]|uniref:DUF4249 domain-containing protein n=1 Tax=uncultured Winogradskyella sp. TaxID=395353 RepID=UPI0026391DF2|nr:DUF4249 domain-containing protein [uncultured Winogradskyella sp.]